MTSTCRRSHHASIDRAGMISINGAKSVHILLAGLLLFGACDRGQGPEGSTASKASARTASNPTTSRAYEDGSWQRRRLAGFNEIARRGEIDLVFLGDSITQRWEAAGREVWAKYYSGRKVANFGMDGDRTQHVLWRIEQGNFESIHPKAIVLLIGDNNSLDGNTPQEIADGILAVVQKLREKVPESKILLLAIFPSGERPDYPSRVRAVAANEIFRKVADGRVIRYLDIGGRFMNRDGTISNVIMPDYDHLSPTGYMLWAEAIEPVVKDLLGEK